MRCKSKISLVAGLFGCVSLSAWGAAPSTQPTSAQPASTQPTVSDDRTFTPTGNAQGFPGDQMGAMGGRGDRRRIYGGGGGGAFGRSQVTADEIAEAMDFMAKYSPKRYEALQGLPPELKTPAQEGTTRLYLGWKRVSNTDHDLYNVIVSRVKLEDAIFGIVGSLNKLTGNDLTSKEQYDRRSLTTELHDTVAQLVELNLKERDLRLKSLAKTLSDQQAQLDRDKDPAMREQLIDERIRTVMNQRGFGQGRMRNHGDSGLSTDPNASPN